MFTVFKQSLVVGCQNERIILDYYYGTEGVYVFPDDDKFKDSDQIESNM